MRQADPRSENARAETQGRRGVRMFGLLGGIFFLALAFAWLQLGAAAAVSLAALAAAAFVGVVALWRPEIAVVALVALSALDVTGRVVSLAGIQVTAYQLGVLAMICALAWRIRTGRGRLAPTPVDLPVIAFLIVAALSGIVATDLRRTLVSVLSLVSSAILLYVTVAAIDARDRARTVVVGLCVLGLIWGLAAIAELKGIVHIQAPWIQPGSGAIRSRVTFHDPNVLAEFLMVVGLFAFAAMMSARRAVWRVFYGITVVVCVAGILATQSRGSFVGLGVGLLLVLALLRVPARYKVALAAAILVIGLVVALFAVDPYWLQQRVLNIAHDPSSLQRVDLLRATWSMSLDHPAGIGAGNFPVVYPYYRVGTIDPTLVESHLTLGTVLVEYGFVGLGLVLLLLWRYFGAVIWTTRRARDRDTQGMAVGVLAASAALAIQSLTYSIETSKFLWFTLGFGMALWVITRTEMGDG